MLFPFPSFSDSRIIAQLSKSNFSQLVKFSATVNESLLNPEWLCDQCVFRILTNIFDEVFCKIVRSFNPLTIIAKSSITYIWQSLKYSSISLRMDIVENYPWTYRAKLTGNLTCQALTKIPRSLLHWKYRLPLATPSCFPSMKKW